MHCVQVYREWTVNREPLLTQRPKRALTDPVVAAFELLPSACTGAWPADLLGMLQSRIEFPHAGIYLDTVPVPRLLQ